jgi:hypothetical protein
VDLPPPSSSRVKELLDRYVRDQATLRDDEKVALMDVIIASYDLALADCEVADGTWERLRDVLRADLALHAPTIARWCAPSASSPEEMFPCSHRMRGLLAELPRARP